MRQLRYTTAEMRLKAFATFGLVGLGLALVSAPEWAHHSFAMFDVKKTVTLKLGKVLTLVSEQDGLRYRLKLISVKL